LSVQKTVSPPASSRGYQAGDVVTWTITVTNVGNQDAVGVALIDDVPLRTTYVTETIDLDGSGLTDAADADAGTYDPTIDQIQVAIGAIAVGETRTVRFATELVPGGGTGWNVENQAVVTGTDTPVVSDDPTTSTDDDPTVIQVVVIGIPVVGPVGTMLLVLLLAVVGVLVLRRR
jgi:uncharacterized repeat protein (TIGR01451 family)